MNYEIKIKEDHIVTVIMYLIIGFVVFVLTNFFSINIAQAVGAGPNDIGIVVGAISILCSIVVVCTMVIVDAIKGNANNKE